MKWKQKKIYKIIKYQILCSVYTHQRWKKMWINFFYYNFTSLFIWSAWLSHKNNILQQYFFFCLVHALQFFISSLSFHISSFFSSPFFNSDFFKWEKKIVFIIPYNKLIKINMNLWGSINSIFNFHFISIKEN